MLALTLKEIWLIKIWLIKFVSKVQICKRNIRLIFLYFIIQTYTKMLYFEVTFEKNILANPPPQTPPPDLLADTKGPPPLSGTRPLKT